VYAALVLAGGASKMRSPVGLLVRPLPFSSFLADNPIDPDWKSFIHRNALLRAIFMEAWWFEDRD
jgi:hypothetical protein